MFTGIVKALRTVKAVAEQPGIRRITIELEELSEGLEIGASVAINGTCLTVAAHQNGTAAFDIIQETLNCTNLGILEKGDRVNIERACRIGDEVGGHHVTGHVDTVGTIQEIRMAPNNKEVFISHDPQWNKYMIPKGWIAVDGISLTVVAVEKNRFSVCLIPETLARTTLGFKDSGQTVNLEFDHTAKVIVATIERMEIQAKQAI
ncbi:MAG: riboflavin synthase subunit alpha [SAR324 cluster bacterium]|nr:riboflavin synthase subunit alpha [SAR324 cluster bacterium]